MGGGVLRMRWQRPPAQRPKAPSKGQHYAILHQQCCHIHMFVFCLFVWGFPSHSRIFHSYEKWRRHRCRWRAANIDLCSALMAIQHGCSLACHTYCDTRHPFIIDLSETLDTHTMLSVWQWSCHYDLVCRGWDSNTQPSTYGANALAHCATAAVSSPYEWNTLYMYINERGLNRYWISHKVVLRVLDINVINVTLHFSKRMEKEAEKTGERKKEIWKTNEGFKEKIW